MADHQAQRGTIPEEAHPPEEADLFAKANVEFIPYKSKFINYCIERLPPNWQVEVEAESMSPDEEFIVIKLTIFTPHDFFADLRDDFTKRNGSPLYRSHKEKNHRDVKIALYNLIQSMKKPDTKTAPQFMSEHQSYVMNDEKYGKGFRHEYRIQFSKKV